MVILVLLEGFTDYSLIRQHSTTAPLPPTFFGGGISGSHLGAEGGWHLLNLCVSFWL